MNMSAVPSCCVYIPTFHCQQRPGHPLSQHLQPMPGQTIQMDISFQTHPQRMLETTHGANENKDTESGIEGKTSDHNILRGKHKLHEDSDWQNMSLPLKKMKAEGKGKNEEFEHLGRKKRHDEEELKEQVGELQERLQILQEKMWKALNENQRKWRKADVREEEEEDRGVYSEAAPFIKISNSPNESEGLNTLWKHWWNGNGEAKFTQFLKVELRSAMARVIDRVLGLYTETSESAPTAVPFLDETNGKWESGLLKKVYKEAQRVDGKDSKNTRDQLTQPSTSVVVQKSEGMCRKLLPEQHLHPLPAVCVSESPLLVSASQPSTPPTSYPTPHLLQSMGPLPLLHFSMKELFSRTLSQQPLHPAKGFNLNIDAAFAEVARPPFPTPGPMIGLPESGHSGGQVELGMKRTGGALDLYFTAGSQEGLSPCHLKKAKLMFFYTRYPSSSALKTYFPDIKFNRCVTSQMIKWFSNFREFFYIQMERFARQAVQDALTLDGGALVCRDRRLRADHRTELYRILNMHYNKSNVYKVPDGFINVSEVALQEFYAAIWTGRDSNPCWKKGIYKIICKLDSPVPDAFLLPGCPVG